MLSEHSMCTNLSAADPEATTNTRADTNILPRSRSSPGLVRSSAGLGSSSNNKHFSVSKVAQTIALLFRITFRMGMTFRSTFKTGDFKRLSKEDLKGYFEAYFKGDLELEGDLI